MSKARVYITQGLISDMLEIISSHMPNETGGLIMGELKGNSKWIITHITAAGPKAVHKRSSYKPDYDYDDGESARIYQETHCNSIYLGDWHSHPGSNAYMSGTDKDTLRTISKSATARIATPIMIICGTAPLEICCWGIAKPTLFGKDIISVEVIMLNDKSEQDIKR